MKSFSSARFEVLDRYRAPQEIKKAITPSVQQAVHRAMYTRQNLFHVRVAIKDSAYRIATNSVARFLQGLQRTR